MEKIKKKKKRKQKAKSVLSADEDLAVPCRVTANSSMRVPGRAQRHSFISVTRTFVKFCFVFLFIYLYFLKFDLIWMVFLLSFLLVSFMPSRPPGPLPCLALHCRSVPFFPRFWICFKPKAVLSIKTTRIGTYISIYVHASV